MAAADLDADFIFTIMEAWALPKDKVRRHQEILDRYGSISKSPYRIDTVSFVLETQYGMWAAQLPILRKGASKKKGTFGEVTLKFMDGAEGRFAGLLSRHDEGQVRRSAFH
jgi:hypothetical protein